MEEDRTPSKDAAFIDGFLLGRWMATEGRETSDGQPRHRDEWHSEEPWCADESRLSEAVTWGTDDGEVVRELVEVEVAVLRPGAAEWQAGETVKSHEEDRR